MRFLFLLALAASALLLPACDSDGDAGETPDFSFEATVTGDDGFRFEGVPFAYSFALVNPEEPSDTLSFSSQIFLSGISGGERPSITFQLAEELAEGTFALGTRLDALRGPSARLSWQEGEAYVMAESTSGALTIGRVDDEAVEGTFRFVTETAYTLPGLGGAPFPSGGGGTFEERPYAVAVEGRFSVDRQMSVPPGGGPRPFPYTPILP